MLVKALVQPGSASDSLVLPPQASSSPSFSFTGKTQGIAVSVLSPHEGY